MGTDKNIWKESKQSHGQANPLNGHKLFRSLWWLHLLDRAGQYFSYMAGIASPRDIIHIQHTFSLCDSPCASPRGIDAWEAPSKYPQWGVIAD